MLTVVAYMVPIHLFRQMNYLKVREHDLFEVSLFLSQPKFPVVLDCSLKSCTIRLRGRFYLQALQIGLYFSDKYMA